MSGISKKLMGTTAAGGGFTAIEDVFSTYLYTGNGSTQTITNDIDLAGEGGLVWIKSRSVDAGHMLFDTTRGAGEFLQSNSTNSSSSSTNTLTSFNSSGFTLGNDQTFGVVNFSPRTYASWTFRKAPRFFDVVTYTGTGSARTVDHNLGVEPGCIIVKATSSSSTWPVWHRSVYALSTSGRLLLNETTGYQNSGSAFNSTNPTDSVFTVGTSPDTNASGQTYVAYLYAHDPLGPSGDGSDGLIACGSVTGTNTVVDLGWEPQFLLMKQSSTSGSWFLVDNMRGFPVASSSTKTLFANSSDAEGTFNIAQPTSTGFINGGQGGTLVYIAIRRGPMRAPESGTEVFATEYMGETLPNPPQWNSGFPVDWGFYKNKDVAGTNWLSSSRLTQGTRLAFNTTDAESALAELKFDYMDGWQDASSVRTDIHGWMFRRAPEFFDVVAYTGTGSLMIIPHNLGVVPELMIFKRRNSSMDWIVYADSIGYNSLDYLILNSNVAKGSGPFGSVSWIGAAPSSTNLNNVGADGVSTTRLNNSGDAYIAYLFATLAGISKVGSYTGNGSSQTINCGFTTGARFILIKRTDAAGDWYVWDTARGIIAGNDPHLSLNTTAAEVTTDDSVDPVSSGFIVNQVAATNINVSAASYIFYAVA